MLFIAVAVALLIPASAAASKVSLSAGRKLQTWHSPQVYAAHASIHVSVQRHRKPLGIHPHTDGCSATFTGKGIIVLLSTCHPHMQVSYISTTDRQRSFVLRYARR